MQQSLGANLSSQLLHEKGLELRSASQEEEVTEYRVHIPALTVLCHKPAALAIHHSQILLQATSGLKHFLNDTRTYTLCILL